MDALRTGLSALGAVDHTTFDETPDQDEAIAVAARFPGILAAFFRLRSGQEPVEPKAGHNTAQSYLWQLFGTEPEERHWKPLETYLVLLADHGMNASTFSARVTIATLSDMYSAITTAIGTLKGPLHGGANEGVIKMLKEIDSLAKVDEYIAECLSQKKKIMGIGHRVYKTLDPRAPHLKRMAQQLSAKLGEPKWIQMSERIAEIMLKEKNLNANVDFYSATVYYSLGIPTDLFTPIFAIARTSGWTAHVLEQLADNRLIRPQSLYTGATDLKVVPLDER